MNYLTVNPNNVINIDPDDWPRCAKCDMPVLCFSGIYQVDQGLSFVVECHGQREVSFIPQEVWDNLVSVADFKIGDAFAGGPNGGNAHY
jgi:hypothetical protein